MTNIVGIEDMRVEDILAEVDKGGRFVQYIWCISIIFMTFKRPSDVFFIRSDESTSKKGLPYTFLTLLFGWWGIPWGPIYSLQCLGVNSSGGYDLTDNFMHSLIAHNQGSDFEDDVDPSVDDSVSSAQVVDESLETKKNNDNKPINRSGCVVRR